MAEESETLAGSYSVITMPDGTRVLMSKDENGKWHSVEDRDRLARLIEEKERWEDTETVPDNWQGNPDAKGAVTKRKPRTAPMQHLEQYVSRVLDESDPVGILERGIKPVILKRLRKEPITVSQVMHALLTLNDPEWNSVIAILERDAKRDLEP
jgi:hypothetical protein